VPVEIVSPILQGENGLIQVYAVVQNFLQVYKARTNATCGIHIHLDARDLSVQQIRQAEAAFITHEKMLYAISGNQAAIRWNNQYCKRSDLWRNDNSHGDLRYRSINLCNVLNEQGEKRVSGKGTIEIRCFASNAQTAPAVITAIVVCMAILTESINYPLPLESPRERIAVENSIKTLVCLLAKEANRIVPDDTSNDVIKIVKKQTQVAKAKVPELSRMG
jgi:hypothetical protein